MTTLSMHADGHHCGAFQSVVRERRLRSVFQPLIDLRSRTFHGYEALIRGPADTALERPDQLFDAARACDQLAAFDQLCARTSIEGFVAQRLGGQLFINVTEALFDSGWFSQDSTLRWLHELGTQPSQLVLELLESDLLGEDSRALAEAQKLRELGYGLALDDLGQGFGRFAVWKRLRPRYLKIDRSFTASLADDPFKAAFVQSMLLLADASQSVVVAEGVESERDLLTLREIGVQMAQGYFIARPHAHPPAEPARVTRQALDKAQPALHALASRGSIEQSVLGLARRINPVHPNTKLESVLRLLETDADLMSVPVVDADGQALGIINRYVMADRLFRPHVRDLFGNKPCSLVMSRDVLRLEAKSSLQQASDLIADSSYRHATEGVLVTEQGQYRGLLLVGDLLRLVTEFQVQAARYANPLTLLPGNVPLNDCIDRWLREGNRFAAAYLDIDNFKAFNDRFGYRMGDEVILLLADLLKSRLTLGESFVGHIGGDDFMALLLSAHWEHALGQILQDFEDGVRGFFDDRTLVDGGYWSENRRGDAVFYPIPSLSIGALCVTPGMFDSHRDLSNVLAEL
ncbi:bifunctional diguanylate cyclase/phosphodiesterase [Thiomonas sp.]|uniref:bifunctional diguanylate cyclase/phosphodiesterase n=1 Tax=Thiomonas sp. TaxID=2047785 RepID=UPI0025873719|nr:bifunctional diguanylate cyclase/phosphodiesterase [Thiomonas sp.]